MAVVVGHTFLPPLKRVATPSFLEERDAGLAVRPFHAEGAAGPGHVNALELAIAAELGGCVGCVVKVKVDSACAHRRHI